jgi:predicted DNA-binding antitoxin AbrB/MazE fold protein
VGVGRGGYDRPEEGGSHYDQVLEAVYEDGILKPLADPGLSEHQRVLLEIRLPAESTAEAEITSGQPEQPWMRYSGLIEGDPDASSTIAEVVYGREGP